MRGLIYTAIIGGRDKPLRVRVPEGNVDYLMFTDGVAPKGWQEVRVPRHENPRLAARLRKVTLPEQAQDYDWVLWIDGSHIPQVPIAPHVEKWLEEKSFAAYKHHHWDCTYTEIKFCTKLGKDRPEKLKTAGQALLNMNFPRHYGQVATTILARRVDRQIVADHSECWDHWIRNFTVRDQVSFMHCIWSASDGDPAEDHLHYVGPNAFKNDLFHYQGGH